MGANLETFGLQISPCWHTAGMFKSPRTASNPPIADANVLARAIELYPQLFATLNDLAAESPAITVRDMRRGEILLGAGEVATHLYLPLSGMLRRHFVNATGKDVTCEVMCAGTAALIWPSLIEQIPSSYSISAVDSATVLCVPSPKLVDDAGSLREPFARQMLADRTRNAQAYDALLGSTPSERFASMLSDSPWMINQLPKHVLASYLGITTVHLGRVRSHFGIGPAQLRNAARGQRTAK